MSKPFKVRDFRNKHFFMVDDIYLNGYARHLGPTASIIYVALCRHADKEQECFPSQEILAEKLNVGLRTVVDKIALLKDWNLIKIHRERTEGGKWLRNTYSLLDKSVWKKLPSAKTAHGYPSAINDKNQVQPLHTKDTHTIRKHITLSRKSKKVTSLNGITEEQMKEIADKYKVPLPFVRSKYDDLINYCERSGKRYKNYLASLRNFVKQDAIKIRERSANDRHKAIDARNI